MASPSFLIVGGNFTNKGAEAMLKTVRFKLLQTYPEAQIYAICHEEEASIAASQGMTPLYYDKSPIVEFTGKVRGKIEKITGLPGKPYADITPADKLNTIKGLKAAIDVSGFAYGDKRGYQQPLETLKVIDFCRKNGAKYFFMPQAWGGFDDPKVAANCIKMLNASDAFFARDEVSRSYLAKLLGKAEDEITLLTDIAFHFPVPELDGKKLLEDNGFANPEEKQLLGISPNMRIFETWPEKGGDNPYVKLFIKVIASLRDKYHVVLIPNEIRPMGSGVKDDSFLCGLIYNELPSQKGITLIKEYRTAEEIKAIIRETDLLIASRFHSLIFGLSLGIPSLAISWSHKYRELFLLFGMQRFVVEDHDMSADGVLSLFSELESNKDDLSAMIKAKLPEIKQKSEIVFKLF
ncbi:MAG: polysaccharide pyruvyl transferase family protein [Balneolales bacterium]|nr:polysaccharide pyruvyl transferase family protein [Balneolales bacterium]